jgi:hypothetical protein
MSRLPGEQGMQNKEFDVSFSMFKSEFYIRMNRILNISVSHGNIKFHIPCYIFRCVIMRVLYLENWELCVEY